MKKIFLKHGLIRSTMNDTLENYVTKQAEHFE